MKGLARLITGARVISGEICLVRICVTSSDEARLDDWPLRILGNSEYRMREEIADAVKESLGREFEVRSLTVGRGSIEILVLIGTAYYVISRYKSFVESMELMVRQVREVVRSILERSSPARLSVSGTWTPVGGIIRSSPLEIETGYAGSQALLWYLIVSHAGMLLVLFWMLLGGLKP